MNSNIPFRRNQVRRQHERRTNLYPFNSPEWVTMMQAHFELWPKQDRREAERRTADRRKLERREAHQRNLAAARHLRQQHWSFSNPVLAEDEKKMILDLFLEG